MSTYALIAGDQIVQLAAATFPVHPDYVWTGDVSAISPAPEVGWTATETNGTWSFTAPAAATVTLAQQAQALLNAGLAITSSGTLTLSAVVFAADGTTQQWINSEIASLLLNGTFADGSSSIVWVDAAGGQHTLTVAQFKVLAAAIGAFVSACIKVIKGVSTTLPAATTTLALA